MDMLQLRGVNVMVPFVCGDTGVTGNDELAIRGTCTSTVHSRHTSDAAAFHPKHAKGPTRYRSNVGDRVYGRRAGPKVYAVDVHDLPALGVAI